MYMLRNEQIIVVKYYNNYAILCNKHMLVETYSHTTNLDF